MATTEVLTQERTIETVTAEILTLKTDAGNAILGIGARLIEAKAILNHGEWLPWLTDQVEFSERTAQDFMRLAREYANPQTLADLGKAKALKLLLLPPAEREEFIEAHDVTAMSSRELEQAIRERDEARKAAEYSEVKLKEVNAKLDTNIEALAEMSVRHTEDAGTITDLKNRIKELESRPVEVAVEVDEEAVKKAAEEAKAAAEAEAEKKLKALEDKLQKAEDAAKKAAAKAEKAADGLETEAAEAKKEVARLRAELAELKSQQAKAAINSDADAVLCREYYSVAVESINKLKGHLLKCRDEGTVEKIRRLLADLEKKAGEAHA